MAKHLSNDTFFLELSELFEEMRKKKNGSIFLTQKRFSHELSPDTWPASTAEEPFPDLKPTINLPIIIRACDGKHNEGKTRLSTIVEAEALEAFFIKYADVCKGGMSGLKKRDRSKLKARMKAKKRKGGAVVVDEIKKA